MREVAVRVIREAVDLVGGVKGLGDSARTIDPHAGAIARVVVAIGVRGAGAFVRTGQAQQAVVGVWWGWYLLFMACQRGLYVNRDEL